MSTAMSTTTITDDKGQVTQPYDIQDVPMIALVYDDVVVCQHRRHTRRQIEADLGLTSS